MNTKRTARLAAIGSAIAVSFAIGACGASHDLTQEVQVGNLRVMLPASARYDEQDQSTHHFWEIRGGPEFSSGRLVRDVTNCLSFEVAEVEGAEFAYRCVTLGGEYGEISRNLTVFLPGGEIQSIRGFPTSWNGAIRPVMTFEEGRELVSSVLDTVTIIDPMRGSEPEGPGPVMMSGGGGLSQVVEIGWFRMMLPAEAQWELIPGTANTDVATWFVSNFDVETPGAIPLIVAEPIRGVSEANIWDCDEDLIDLEGFPWALRCANRLDPDGAFSLFIQMGFPDRDLWEEGAWQGWVLWGQGYDTALVEEILMSITVDPNWQG